MNEDRTVHESEVTDYTKILGTGKENGTSARDLMRQVGASDERALRNDVARSRKAGQIILSGNSGYYLPGSPEEVDEFVNRLERTAKSIFVILRSARSAATEPEGQQSILDLLEDDARQRSLDKVAGSHKTEQEEGGMDGQGSS